ncbi:MAG: hypothetical protein SGILL_005053 [Bacillariaceae sp.]
MTDSVTAPTNEEAMPPAAAAGGAATRTEEETMLGKFDEELEQRQKENDGIVPTEEQLALAEKIEKEIVMDDIEKRLAESVDPEGLSAKHAARKVLLRMLKNVQAMDVAVETNRGKPKTFRFENGHEFAIFLTDEYVGNDLMKFKIILCKDNKPVLLEYCREGVDKSPRLVDVCCDPQDNFDFAGIMAKGSSFVHDINEMERVIHSLHENNLILEDDYTDLEDYTQAVVRCFTRKVSHIKQLQQEKDALETRLSKMAKKQEELKAQLAIYEEGSEDEEDEGGKDEEGLDKEELGDY